MTDVYFKCTGDGGDIEIKSGDVETRGGMETAAYLCLFSGSNWWGDEGKFRSATDEFLDGSPPLTSQMPRLKAAVDSDLFRLVRDGAATAVSSSVFYSGVRNRIDVSANVDGVGNFKFSESWRQDIGR